MCRFGQETGRRWCNADQVRGACQFDVSAQGETRIEHISHDASSGQCGKSCPSDEFLSTRCQDSSNAVTALGKLARKRRSFECGHATGDGNYDFFFRHRILRSRITIIVRLKDSVWHHHRQRIGVWYSALEQGADTRRLILKQSYDATLARRASEGCPVGHIFPSHVRRASENSLHHQRDPLQIVEVQLRGVGKVR
jgi:hypothetical protein